MRPLPLDAQLGSFTLWQPADSACQGSDDPWLFPAVCNLWQCLGTWGEEQGPSATAVLGNEPFLNLSFFFPGDLDCRVQGAGLQ